MKLMVCHGLALGELPGVDLPAVKIASWQADKVSALQASIRAAVAAGAEACLLAGGTFADGFVSQETYEGACNAMASSDIPICCLLKGGEAEGIEGRVELPSNVELVRVPTDSTVELGIGLVAWNLVDGRAPEEVARTAHAPSIVLGDFGAVLCSDGLIYGIGPLEPSSFSDQTASGYLLCEVDDGGISGFEWVKRAEHPYVLKTVLLDEAESSKEAIVTVGNAVKDCERAAFLRIELHGKLPLDVYVNADELAARLGEYFSYVEVADFCTLDINVDELGADVSLLAEFVRQVSGDDSLSETEKTRIVRCGWNALNGKETVE